MNSPSEDIQAPDTAPGPYYVSIVDGGRLCLALGPFRTHAPAIAAVSPVRTYCNRMDGRCHFMTFGTVRVTDGTDTPGRLNDRLPHLLQP